MPLFPDARGARAVALAGFALAIAWFAVLPMTVLMSTDEGRYASLSLAMLESGDWITPRLDGFLYFEKPPLQYWFGAIAMAVFGVNAFAARLGPALAGFATVLLLAMTAARLWGRRAGVRAFFIAVATTWINGNAHFLALDAGLAAALTLTLCAFLLAKNAGIATAEGGRWMLAAWLGVALGLLQKGPVALFIPGAVLVAASLWRLDFRDWRHLRLLQGAAIVAVVAVPWFVVVSLRNPDFASFFFVHEHLDRYLTTEHGRFRPWWFFVPVLVGGLLPWSGALPWLLRPHRDDAARSLLVAWVVVVFVFFSASQSKLVSYVLPVFPALVLLAARALEDASTKALGAIVALPTLLWLGALVLVATGGIARVLDPQNPPPADATAAMARGVVIGAAVFLAAAGAAFALLRRRRVTLAIVAVAAGHCIATLVGMVAQDAFGQLRSASALSKALLPLLDPTTPVYAVRAYDQTLPFYLRRPIVLVDYVDEFAFGEEHEPGRAIPTLDAFVGRWLSPGPGAAYLRRDTYDELAARHLPMRIVFEDLRRLVVVKP